MKPNERYHDLGSATGQGRLVSLVGIGLNRQDNTADIITFDANGSLFIFQMDSRAYTDNIIAAIAVVRDELWPEKAS